MSIPLLMRDVRRTYRRGWRRRPVVAVVGVSFEIGAGEIACLVGAPGSGKTTLLRLGAGLERPDAGVVRVGGEPAQSAAARRVVGFAPRESAFPPALTVREVLDHFARCHAGGSRYRARLVRDALEEAGLEGAGGRRAASLPLGETRRLLMAQAALGARRVVVLDEPFAGLDAITRRDLGERLIRLATAGAALLVSTSDPVGLERVVDRVLVLRAGRLACSAPAAVLLGGRVLEVVLDAPPAEPPPGFRLTPLGLETDLGRGTAEAALALCRAHRLRVRASRVRLKTLDEAMLDPLDAPAR
jgi:ABC-type multidrug transport system ATPase subunit